MICFFISGIMYRGTVFMVICVLPLVTNIREDYEPSAFDVRMVI
jgi:hypothetical protein